MNENPEIPQVSNPLSAELPNASMLDAKSDDTKNGRQYSKPITKCRPINSTINFNRDFNQLKENANRNEKQICNKTRTNHRTWARFCSPATPAPTPSGPCSWSEIRWWELASRLAACAQVVKIKNTSNQNNYPKQKQLLESEPLGTLGGSHEHA